MYIKSVRYTEEPEHSRRDDEVSGVNDRVRNTVGQSCNSNSCIFQLQQASHHNKDTAILFSTFFQNQETFMMVSQSKGVATTVSTVSSSPPPTTIDATTSSATSEATAPPQQQFPPLPNLIEVRPGRWLNVFQWTIHSQENSNNNSSTNATSSSSRGGGSRIDDATNVDGIHAFDDTKSTGINLICIHGTAANHRQFIPLLVELEKQLQQQQEEQEGGEKRNTENNIDQYHTTRSIHYLSYDAMGCGYSPIADAAADDDDTAYSDDEQVKDLEILLLSHSKVSMDLTLPTYFLGHSYGPNWIYKFLLQQQQQTQHLLLENKINLHGLILISSGVANPKYSLQKGGPALFRIIPLWILRCLQPLLTQSFLTLGFSPSTHQTNPTLIVQSKIANNQNDMSIVCHYYHSHVWITTEGISQLTRKILLSPRRIKQGEEDLSSSSTSSSSCFCSRSPLILHGLDDQIVPVECGQELANAFSLYGVGGADAGENPSGDNDGNDDDDYCYHHDGTTIVKLVTIPNASHMILLEQPKLLAESIWNYMMPSFVS